MQHKSGNKSKIGHAEGSCGPQGLSISRLQRRCQTTTNNPKEGGPELQPFRTTALFNKTAFTLIELLVVVLIIGILAAIAVPQYQITVKKARVSKEMIYVHHLAQLATEYQLANGTWPTQFSDLGENQLPGCTGVRSGDNYVLACSLFYRIQINKTGKMVLRYCYANKDNEFEKKLCQALTKSKTYWASDELLGYHYL